MITLTRGIGDRNEGRGEEERVFVSSLFLPVPRIPFLPDARNLQPSVFFFFEGIGRRRRPSKGREEEEHATARPPFSTSLLSFFFHFFFLSVSTDKRYDSNCFSDPFFRFEEEERMNGFARKGK